MDWHVTFSGSGSLFAYAASFLSITSTLIFGMAVEKQIPGPLRPGPTYLWALALAVGAAILSAMAGAGR